MSKCTRNFYEEPVAIRGTKLQAAKGGYDSVLGGLKAEGTSGKKVAIVGGGPAGIALSLIHISSNRSATLVQMLSGSL